MPDFWLPLTSELLIDGATSRLKRPNGNFLDLIGRVHAGVDSKSLEAKVKVELHDWLASHVPDMEPGEKQLWSQQTLHLIPGGAGVAAMRDQYEEGLKLLLIAAGCVLLVACANLAKVRLPIYCNSPSAARSPETRWVLDSGDGLNFKEIEPARLFRAGFLF